MKFCFDYNRYSKVLAKLDEINIKCNPKELSVLLDYIEEHKHQTINVRFNNEEDILDYNLFEKFSDFQRENQISNFVIILPKYNLNFAAICKEKGLKFFFDVVVRDWETFNALIQAGASELYLVEQMMFEIKKAADAAHAKNVKIRTFPNIAQRRYDETEALKCFFIRPEDIDLYEGLVDVMEIYTIEEINQDVVYEVYAETKIWWGQLKEIIIGFDDDLDNKYIIPRFGERRIVCERKCFKGATCDVCEVTKSLAKNLEKAGLLIKYNKNKEDIDNGKRSREQESNNE